MKHETLKKAIELTDQITSLEKQIEELKWFIEDRAQKGFFVIDTGMFKDRNETVDYKILEPFFLKKIHTLSTEKHALQTQLDKL